MPKFNSTQDGNVITKTTTEDNGTVGKPKIYITASPNGQITDARITGFFESKGKVYEFSQPLTAKKVSPERPYSASLSSVQAGKPMVTVAIVKASDQNFLMQELDEEGEPTGDFLKAPIDFFTYGSFDQATIGIRLAATVDGDIPYSLKKDSAPVMDAASRKTKIAAIRAAASIPF